MDSTMLDDTTTDIYNTSSMPTECNTEFLLSETTLAFIVAVLENLLAVTVLGTYRSRSNNTHKLLTLMAGNDLTSTTVALVLGLTLIFTCHGMDRALCNLMGLLVFTLFCWSLHIVAVMNVERYLMICHPIYHRNKVNGRYLTILCASGLCVITVLLGLPLVGVGDPYMLYEGNKLCAVNLVPGLTGTMNNILLAMYSVMGTSWVVVTLATNMAMTRKLGQGGGGAATEAQAKTRKKMQAFNLVTKVVAGVNCVLNLPFYMKLLVGVATQPDNIRSPIDSLATVLWVMTPIVNPILYIAFNKNYRRHLGNMCKRLSGCRCCHDNSVSSFNDSQATTNA